MQSNLDRIALTFRRRIYGIHNQTRGIIFDVVECIIQRTFGYTTPDVRIAYKTIHDVVTEQGNDAARRWKKIVLILHSQGAVEGELILDLLYTTTEMSLLNRIEVYTFGNAGNHLNSPCVRGSPAVEPGVRAQQRAIRHIEHYANLGDYVSRFGILNFRPLPNDEIKQNSKKWHELQDLYVGRLFVRKGQGHMMNGNYLDSFFPMNSDLTMVLEDNDFMSSEVNEELLKNYSIASKTTEEDAWTISRSMMAEKEGQLRKLKDISRLWLYRNGGSPKD